MHILTQIIKYLILFLGAVIVLALIIGLIRTWQTERSARQAEFLAGARPDPAPDGLYKGSVPGRTVSWLGKKFYAAKNSGINIFDDGNGVRGERYPFATAYAKGARDKNTDVLAIDYNISGNPLWLKLILDEIVQVAPGKYLGKLYLRVIPGYPFALGYFELQ